MMYLKNLVDVAGVAIDEINRFIKVYGESSPLTSILNQMLFIREKSAQGVHPVDALGDEKFTYSIIASREFASPEEMELYEYITDVSRVMDLVEH